MTGAEQFFLEVEKGFWLLVMFGAGCFVSVYIAKIVSDIKEEIRHKKLVKKWKEQEE